MKYINFSAFLIVLISCSTIVVWAQKDEDKIDIDVNKPIIKGGHQIPSPKTNRVVLATHSAPGEVGINEASINTIASNTDVNAEDKNKTENELNNSSANDLSAIARKESLKVKIASKPLTEIYRVGAGDVLDIRMLNGANKESTLYTVLEGGILDFPLAGEPINVNDLTVEEISEILSEKIKLYDSPEIAVSVRDHSSHKVVISGLVGKPGTKILRREAVPLFVLLAEAEQLPEAARAVILRTGKETENINLNDVSNNILVKNGDVIRIFGKNVDEELSTQFYFIGGSVSQPGQKKFHQGLSLTQAVLAAGGTTKSSRVIILRQNEAGLLHSQEYDLKLIRTGKVPDPILLAGDRIEIR